MDEIRKRKSSNHGTSGRTNELMTGWPKNSYFRDEIISSNKLKQNSSGLVMFGQSVIWRGRERVPKERKITPEANTRRNDNGNTKTEICDGLYIRQRHIQSSYVRLQDDKRRKRCSYSVQNCGTLLSMRCR